MANPGLADRLATAPLPSRPDLARSRLDDLRRWLPSGSSLEPLLARAPVAALLQAIADHSPYLWRLATGDPDRLARCLVADPRHSLTACLSSLAEAGTRPGATAATVMDLLRRSKADVALLVALADLGGVWTLDEVTGALTAFADIAVRAALQVLLLEAHRAGKLRLPDPERPEDGCGLVILALGKQGGGELNYSSDIDIVAFFDPSSAAVPPGVPAAPIYVRLTQSLARMLSQPTGLGYALRVDLRLRPDPGSTAVAIGLPSALAYYEHYGQNWERAALIKARPFAGERDLGHALLRDLSAFIWRKYFDFGAIADVHAMKRQIHAVRGHAVIALEGHDVKLGRGGIREIEFFVQTQQLIFGGRRAHLRGARTLDMLAALSADGWIDRAAVDDLGRAYRFLRAIEHRLQMINDEQTQRLPVETDALDAFARFAGFAGRAAFSARFLAETRAVESHYAKLFEQAPSLDSEGGNLVFTGVDDDPGTIATLRGLGFSRPEQAAETVRGWHYGRRAAVRSARARELLTELVPALLRTFAQSGDADAALAAFDAMLGRMQGAGELFSMLKSNRALLDLFGDVLGAAPRLAATVSRRPHVLDAAIDPAMLAAAGRSEDLERRIGAALGPALPTEDFLDRVRDIAREEQFLIGTRLLANTDGPRRAAHLYSDLADLVIRAVLARCAADLAVAHGPVEQGTCVVVAMGRLGSREMTATSDLDLMVIYDVDPLRGDSTGARPIAAPLYYTRLTQRLIAGLTVTTRRGGLYEVDMRLRPSGRQGPLATRFSSFLAYQTGEAATWERLALTRARVVAGDAALAAKVDAAIGGALARAEEPDRIRAEARKMRGLIAREKGSGGAWDLKLAPGGLLDIEFIAQALVLIHARDHSSLRVRETASILSEARRIGLLDDATADALLGACDVLTALTQMARLTTDGPFDPAVAGLGVRRRMAAIIGLPDFARVEADLRTRTGRVRAAFVAMIGDPDETVR